MRRETEGTYKEFIEVEATDDKIKAILNSFENGEDVVITFITEDKKELSLKIEPKIGAICNVAVFDNTDENRHRFVQMSVEKDTDRLFTRNYEDPIKGSSPGIYTTPVALDDTSSFKVVKKFISQDYGNALKWFKHDEKTYGNE